jgi:hypothetical protein
MTVMLSLLLAGATLRQGPPAPPSSLTFSATAELITFQLSIINEKTRQPVVGLTAKDFAVKVDKKSTLEKHTFKTGTRTFTLPKR